MKILATHQESEADFGGDVVANLNAILVDDDPMSRGLLREFLEKSNDITVIGEVGTVQQARILAQKQTPNVVFLEVNLPDGLGFDLLADLNAQTSVIIVTSNKDYAVQAFDCEVADYLLKPVKYVRLQQALVRVRQRFAALGMPESNTAPKLKEAFLVKTRDEKIIVKVGDITRIIACGEYSWMYWSKGKGALLRKSLKQWMLELPCEQFVRVHRRAIVNLAFMERIEKLPGWRLQISLRDTAEPILVSLRLAPLLNKRLKAFRG